MKGMRKIIVRAKNKGRGLEGVVIAALFHALKICTHIYKHVCVITKRRVSAISFEW